MVVMLTNNSNRSITSNKNFYISLCLQRFVLPVFITISVVIRPCFLSLIYLMYLLYLPFVPIVSRSNYKGRVLKYFTSLIGISFLTTLLQICFQIVLLSLSHDDLKSFSDSNLEHCLFHFGLVRISKIPLTSLLHWIAPEFLMLFASVLVGVLLKRTAMLVPAVSAAMTTSTAAGVVAALATSTTAAAAASDGVECVDVVAETTAASLNADNYLTDEEGLVRHTRTLTISKVYSNKFFVSLGLYVTLLMFCLAGIVRPSIFGAVYFLTFLSAITYWATCRQLNRKFAVFMRLVFVILLGHILVLYVSQLKLAQDQLEPLDPNYHLNRLCRYFGIIRFISFDQFEPRDISFVSYQWDNYAYPIFLLILYFAIIIESRMILNFQVAYDDVLPVALSEQTPLIRGVSTGLRYGSNTSSVRVHSESVAVNEDLSDNALQLDYLEEDEGPNFFENVLISLDSTFQKIVQSSYIGTNITMMVWSITYHSWLGFVLMLWAIVLWIFPNQRRSMMRSSPFIVCYAFFLLVSQYVYCMDLTENELPSVVQGVNLAQIGFAKILQLPFNTLFMKSAFTLMFLATMRQYMRERNAERQSSVFCDFVAPLHLAMGTSAVKTEQEVTGTKLMKRLADILQAILIKFWIWVVVMMLFVSGIAGDRITGFRIVYMALFLFFVLTFQLSYQLWRKIMYVFWMTVIIISVTILVLVYTYQFDNFSDYWYEYLSVPKKLQLDIGLEVFQTKELFVRLLTPTFFVVITVIQMQYFHADFLKMTDLRTGRENVSDTNSDWRNSRNLAGPGSRQLAATQAHPPSPTNFSPSKINSLHKVSTLHLRTAYLKSSKFLLGLWDLSFLLLDFHMTKLVTLIIMLVCVHDVCAIHLSLVTLLVFSFCFGRFLRKYAIFLISCIVSAMILFRMVYQMEYIDHNRWNVQCTNSSTPDSAPPVLNTASWLGFDKTDSTHSLNSILTWYLVFIFLVTLRSIIFLRQMHQRVGRNEPVSRPNIMFAEIDRKKADDNLLSCAKYLLNYGFYKFGIEVTLIAIVILIGIRMDMFAIFYSLWLLATFNRSRESLSKIWKFFLLFLMAVIPIQYAMAVGLPPFLCFELPWASHSTSSKKLLEWLRDWAFLSDPIHPPNAKRIVCDFVVLLLAARQSIVFRIEYQCRLANIYYPGGSNCSIIHLAETRDFVNPVPDFVAYITSWLDILKKVVLMRFLWLALATVFLAGANRTNVFSIGYLIGSFWFLWQGSDFYLKPIAVMIKSWNILLGYNVTVIFLKCLLQILSCTLVLSNYPSACAVFQMLGVGCALADQDIDPASIHDSHLVSDAIIGSNSESQCFDANDVGLRWDAICFVFVIFQRRLFNSYNLFHIIEDTKAMTILASRGAELIEELRQKQIVQMSEHERMVLEKIKRKMDRIKRNQQKIQGPKYQDPINHYIAIRSGDYYMFDIADEEDDDDLELSLASAEDSLDQPVHKSHGLTVFEFIDTTLKSDMDAPLKARYGIEDKPKKPKRRLSEPILSSKQTYLFHTYSFTGERTARSDLLSSDIRATMPGTSRDSASPDFLQKDLEEPLNCFQKVYKILLFVWIFIESIILSATNCLNRFSRNYRYVSKVLKREKIILKEFTDFTKGSRRGSNQIWQPNYTFYALMEKAKTTMSEQKLKSLIEVSDLSLDNQPTLIRFLCALWFLILSHSEILCYLIIFLNQIKSASILSIPLPLMVFLWGTLTVPRPTISFWVVIIAYTELIVLLKCIVQFDIWPWDQDWITEMMGIEREQNYAAYDLMLLISVFFHRFMLKSLGLWKSTPKTTLVPESYYKKGDDKEISLISQDNEASCSGLNVISMTTVRQRKGSNIKSSEDGKKQISEQQLQEKKVFEFDLKKSGSRFSKRLSNQLGVRIVSRNYIMKKEFFARLLDHNFKVPTDVYAYMFLCDFINFLVIIFGFSDFGAQQSDGGVSSYLEENKVPIPFLGMLILQFILIIIDRAIFLRKNIVGKLWFQFFIVFGVHVGMFFLLPALTERKFNANLSPQLWYMMKCFYLILSAFQIRSGYPTRILGNYFCKGYNYINMVFYKCFMLVPFLFELRTIMDWMWTDTSMTIFDWLKMEDIFSHIYQLKCSRYVEKEYPQERGAKKSPLIKYFMGGIGLFVVIVIIWFPLLLFAFGNTVGEPNLPVAMNLKLEIGSYEALYKAKVDNFYIYGLPTSDSYNKFKDKFKKIGREAVQFLSNYDYDDIGVIKMSQSSGSIWSISPPDRGKLISDLQSNRSVKLRLIYSLSRLSVTNSSEIVTGNKSIELPPTSSANVNNTIRQDLIRIISGSSPNANASILIQNIFPKFLKVTNRAKVSNVPQLVHFNVDENEKTYRNLTISLNSLNQLNWWQIKETCTDSYYEKFLQKIPYSDCDSLVFYTFNDKRFPPSLSVISGGGIISLYTTLVFVASRVIRGFFSDICFKIMFEDMPNVDRILQLCLDIYLVRESRELALEEDLFAKLIFLFRSPETLIKWSRMKENTVRRKARNGSTSRDDDNNSTYNLTSAVSE